MSQYSDIDFLSDKVNKLARINRQPAPTVNLRVAHTDDPPPTQPLYFTHWMDKINGDFYCWDTDIAKWVDTNSSLINFTFGSSLEGNVVKLPNNYDVVIQTIDVLLKTENITLPDDTYLVEIIFIYPDGSITGLGEVSLLGFNNNGDYFFTDFQMTKIILPRNTIIALEITSVGNPGSKLSAHVAIDYKKVY